MMLVPNFRSADGVPPIQRALRSTQHLNALDIEKLPERHRRSGEIDAVEVHRRTRIRTRVDDVCPDSANRQLGEIVVL